MIDYLTRWVSTLAVPDCSVTGVLDGLKSEILCRHGIVNRIITDPGPSFKSSQFVDFLSSWGIQHVMATASHPQTNRLCERMNRTLTAALRAYVNVAQDNWDTELPMVTFCINTAQQETAKFTPFELVYGRRAVLPPETSFPWPPASTETRKGFIRRVILWRKLARNFIKSRQQRSEK